MNSTCWHTWKCVSQSNLQMPGFLNEKGNELKFLALIMQKTTILHWFFFFFAVHFTSLCNILSLLIWVAIYFVCFTMWKHTKYHSENSVRNTVCSVLLKLMLACELELFYSTNLFSIKSKRADYFFLIHDRMVPINLNFFFFFNGRNSLTSRKRVHAFSKIRRTLPFQN